MISLNNLYLVDFEHFPLQRINQDDVISLTFGFYPSVKNVLEYITYSTNIQYMHVSDATPFPLGNMKNYIVEIDCIIPFSKHKQLRVLKLSHCKNLRISALNTEQLEQVHIKECPGVLKLILANWREQFL
jgi:hypothetical protein